MSGSTLRLRLDGADPATLYAASTCTGAAATTTVGCWKYKSTNTNDATQTTAANRPILTSVAAHIPPGFDGTNDLMSLTATKFPTARTTSTLFAVASTTDATNATRDAIWWGSVAAGGKRTLFKSGYAVAFDNGGGGATQPGIN